MADRVALEPSRPLLSPSIAVSTSLADDINTATRAVHTQLNRLITARLPLALPPTTTSPHLYALGLSRFAQIYEQFEDSWNSLLNDCSSSNHALLANLHLPELERSARFRADLAGLDTAAWDVPAPTLRAFLEHISTSIPTKPHLLYAYSWIFYMALFSGGRWIRAQVQAARDSSWDSPLEPHSHVLSNPEVSGSKTSFDVAGLSFLRFDGDFDGEDIKAEFKGRVIRTERALTSVEREEIVTEAGTIFRSCIAIVEELDRTVAELPNSQLDQPTNNPRQNWICLRNRMPAISLRATDVLPLHPYNAASALIRHLALVAIVSVLFYGVWVVKERHEDATTLI